MMPAVALLRELEERGYRGEVSLLQKYLRKVRPHGKPEPLVRFETAPGEQLQFDRASFRRGRRPLVAFVATLGYSRMGFLRFADNARIETLLGGPSGNRGAASSQRHQVLWGRQCRERKGGAREGTEGKLRWSG
jgi:hypothetical protein